METKDLTIDSFIPRDENGLIWRKCKLVVVKHAENNFSTFLVTDCKKPQVPGYPACCLTYYKSEEDAYKDIQSVYKRLNFQPEFPEKKEFYIRG